MNKRQAIVSTCWDMFFHSNLTILNVYLPITKGEEAQITESFVHGWLCRVQLHHVFLNQWSNYAGPLAALLLPCCWHSDSWFLIRLVAGRDQPVLEKSPWSGEQPVGTLHSRARLINETWRMLVHTSHRYLHTLGSIMDSLTYTKGLHAHNAKQLA